MPRPNGGTGACARLRVPERGSRGVGVTGGRRSSTAQTGMKRERRANWQQHGTGHPARSKCLGMAGLWLYVLRRYVRT